MLESIVTFIGFLFILILSHKLISFEKKYRRREKIKAGYNFDDMTKEEQALFDEYKEYRNKKKS